MNAIAKTNSSFLPRAPTTQFRKVQRPTFGINDSVQPRIDTNEHQEKREVSRAVPDGVNSCALVPVGGSKRHRSGPSLIRRSGVLLRPWPGLQAYGLRPVRSFARAAWGTRFARVWRAERAANRSRAPQSAACAGTTIGLGSACALGVSLSQNSFPFVRRTCCSFLFAPSYGPHLDKDCPSDLFLNRE